MRFMYCYSIIGLTLAIVISGCSPISTKPHYPSTYRKGFNIYFLDYPNVYDSADFDLSLQRLCSNGVNTVFLVPHHFSPTEFSDSIFRTNKTIPLSDLDAAIMQCKQKQLAVALKPHINLTNGNPRFRISPRNEGLWQQQYLALMEQYVELSNRHGLPLLVVGTELDAVADKEVFRHIVRAIRGSFAGELVYSSSYDFFIASSLWDMVDYIGVNAYFCLSNSDDPAFSTLLTQWNSRLKLLSAFSQRQGKPVIITEVGYCSKDGCFKNPGDWTIPKQVNMAHQAACYEALLTQALYFPSIQGIFWWHWRLHNNQGKDMSHDLDYTPQGKPAEQVIRTYWSDEFE
ncbi:MAG: hypothetical protein JW795_05910 [Chitinivibrionales bacterium]|nr:hypothetical protein [Chitinivibrionales bacterium]